MLGESAIVTQIVTSNKKYIVTSNRKFKVKVNSKDIIILYIYRKPLAIVINGRTTVI